MKNENIYSEDENNLERSSIKLLAPQKIQLRNLSCAQMVIAGK
jgi:hypothetical protein